MKEVIEGKILSQPQRHAEKFETQIEHDGFESWVYLSECFPPGKVIITVSTKEREGGEIE